MLSFILSTAASAVLIGVLLFITRQRLARQFEDIQRRQVEIERAVGAIKLTLERSTTDAQLERLHLGLVRMQENMARRHEALTRSTCRRSLTDLQSATLRQWGGALGVELEDGRIEELVRAIERAEIFEPKDIQITTPDLLAHLIALLGQRDRNVVVGIMGAPAGLPAPFLRRAAAGFFEQMDVRRIPDDLRGAESLNALIFCASAPLESLESSLGLVKEGGILLVHATDADRTGVNFTGFELVAAEWNTRLYRKGPQ